jgi:hypothetical protein
VGRGGVGSSPEGVRRGALPSVPGAAGGAPGRAPRRPRRAALPHAQAQGRLRGSPPSAGAHADRAGIAPIKQALRWSQPRPPRAVPAAAMLPCWAGALTRTCRSKSLKDRNHSSRLSSWEEEAGPRPRRRGGGPRLAAAGRGRRGRERLAAGGGPGWRARAHCPPFPRSPRGHTLRMSRSVTRTGCEARTIRGGLRPAAGGGRRAGRLRQPEQLPRPPPRAGRAASAQGRGALVCGARAATCMGRAACAHRVLGAAFAG